MHRYLDELRRTEGIDVLGSVPVTDSSSSSSTSSSTTTVDMVLSADALRFVAGLQRRFNGRRLELLHRRTYRQLALDAGVPLAFLPQTAATVRQRAWTCAPPAPGLVDRRVEITGPVDRKMVINALNSGASCFMADFEDSNAPTWENNLLGHVNLIDANKRTISLTVGNREYRLNPRIATLIVRPRGWHLEEKHVFVDGLPMSASLFDFGLYFFHNARLSLEAGIGPYFYLPKMESHLEARLWNDVFIAAQEQLGLPRGTIRATCLIETLPAAFEMDEFLYELREHSSGLNCGRWDYIFSTIKRLRNNPEFVLPDRGDVTMTVPFMNNYVQLLIKTCHRRGVHAMGGMAAQIPIKGDQAANDAAMAKVRADKLREVKAGHDGTWVAHPGLVGLAMEVFNEHMRGPNQLRVLRDDVDVAAKDLLPWKGTVHGQITEAGIRGNINVGLQYMEAWLRGVGCVPIHNLMEDAATAEISRSQLWQWMRHRAAADKGQVVTQKWILQLVNEEVEKIRQQLGEAAFAKSKFLLAKDRLLRTLNPERYEEFLTLICYDDIISAPSFVKARM